MSEIDCSEHTTREINQAIKRAAAEGAPEVRLTNPAARHSLAVAVMHPIRVVFDGPVGWYCAGMSDGPEVVVHGNCGPMWVAAPLPARPPGRPRAGATRGSAPTRGSAAGRSDPQVGPGVADGWGDGAAHGPRPGSPRSRAWP